ncbi:MAG: hypothetical protein AAGE65_01435 [Planctomycetota bacterium]
MSESREHTGPAASADPTTPTGSGLPWLWGLTLLLVVGGSAIGGYAWLEQRGGLDPPAAANPEADDVSAWAPPTVQPDRDYYVHVRLAELRATRADGDPWDWWDESAPDVYVRMKWQGVLVYESLVRDDDFVARWDLLGADVRDVVTGVVTGTAAEMDLESLINAQPVHVRPDTAITVEVWESDRLNDQLVATIPLELPQMNQGVTRLRFSEDEQPELARLEVTIIDCATPLPELLEMVGQR